MVNHVVPIINVRSSSGQHHSTLLDKNIDTVWVDTRDHAWVELDLGVKQKYTSLNIAFGDGLNRAYHFSIYAENTPDDPNSKRIFDGHNKKTNALATYNVKDAETQFIRIVVHSNDSSQPTKAQIAYVEVFNEDQPQTATASKKLVARMTTPASANVNSIITLDGTRSEGNIEEYEFRYAGGTPGSSFRNKNAEGSIVEFTAPAIPGKLKVKLTVKNDKNKADSDTDEIIVTGPVTPPPTHVCEDVNAHWDEAQQKCVCNPGFHPDNNGICVKDTGPPPPPQPAGEIYNTDADFKANVGKTLKKEEALLPEKVFWPSHAGGGDQGSENHKVVENTYNGQKIIQKELHGNKVRDYLNNTAIIPEATATDLELEVDDFVLSPDAKDLSIKFGNHSDPTGRYIFGGYGFSLHPTDWESKNEYNHAEATSSNDGNELSGKLPKPIKFDGKTLYSLIVRCQNVAGKREKVLTAAVKYPGDANFTEITDNMPRRWTNANWLKGTDAKNKKDFDDDLKTYNPKPKDGDEVASGVYISGLRREWVRLNGAAKKAKLFYRRAAVRTIQPRPS